MAPKRSSQQLMAMAGAGIAAALSMRALLKPRHQDTDSRLLDWESVRTNAYKRTQESGFTFHSAELDAACDADARQVAPWLAEVCTDAPIAFPKFQAIDRRTFVDKNIVIVQRLTKPLEELRSEIGQSRLSVMSRTVSSRYVGELLGIMSRRVLGQYDPVLTLDETTTGETALFVVQSNIQAYAKKYGVAPESMRRWIIMHELTHAWQFEQHPWLHEYMRSTMSDLMMSDAITNDKTARVVARNLPVAVRKQVAGISKIQAVMSLLEGYSNYVMNQLGGRHLDDFTELEKSFHQRRSEKSILERLVLALTGINMKLKQYEIGEKFCTAVVSQAGIERLNLVWQDASMVPTMAELKAPKLWLNRI